MKGMSKRVSLKEQEVVQIYIFPNEEGAWHSCRKRQRALVIQALLWLATGTQQSQRSSGALGLNSIFWVQCPQGSKDWWGEYHET